MTGYTVYHERIPEVVVPGKPLGRHVRFDSRSEAYGWQRSGVPVATRLWARYIPILNQGDVGSCTGNAETGALATAPLWAALSAAQQATLNETGALSLYSAAETIDGDGPYPPQDNGSSGTSVCQAALNAGLISAYQHCLSVGDMCDALQAGPVIVGVNWYTGFDNPDVTGLVSIGPDDTVRGGHEFLIRGLDVTAQIFDADNSWGISWGFNGSFRFTWGTMARLLSEQGDCMAPVPLGVPVPVPVPPAPPVPVPVPVDANPADVTLAEAVTHWAAHERHAGQDHTVALALQDWLSVKGFIG